jgi:hypothetical protein
MESTFPNALASIRAQVILKLSGGKRLFLGGFALALIVGGLVWQWNWLVAIGAAPLLISAAPCVAMCGLGLCMHRMCSRNVSTAPNETSRNASPQTGDLT